MRNCSRILRASITSLLLLAGLMTVSAQQVATYRDSAAWDPTTNTPSWNTAGYDVLLTQTNVTSTQLGSSNAVPVLAGVLGQTRIFGVNNTQTAFNTFLASNPAPLPYLLWARTAANPVGGTNFIVSDWTNIVVTWTSLPLPPSNLRVRPAP